MQTLPPWLRQLLPGSGMMLRVVRVGSAIGSAVGTLAAVAWVLRIDEFHQAIAQVRSRLKRA